MESHDVAVIGGGFSGLSAARHLVTAGLDVVVLEALPVVGGRTRTATVDGDWIELGGQWASPDHRELLALAAEFGVSTFPTSTEGRDLMVADGRRSDLADNPSAPGFVAAIAQLDSLAISLPDDEPWTSPRAAEFDVTTLVEWAEQELADPGVRRQVVRTLEELMTAPGDELSLLTILQSARSSGSLAAAMGIEGGAQEIRFDGGLQQIAQRLADQLGEVVRTEWPVSGIRDDGDVVITGDRGVIRARRAIVALAPSMASHVVFEPPLPDRREALHQQMAMGSVIKVNVVYDRPFWRDEGLSGHVLDFDGPLTYVVDNASPTQAHGMLVSFFAGDRARRISALGEDARRRAVLEQAVRWFGPLADKPSVYLDHDWTVEPWIGGGYSGFMLPGAWQTCGPALREPVGALHWASSETSVEWTGYVEGAIRAGYRAAAEVIDHHE